MEREIQLDIGDICDLRCKFCIDNKSLKGRRFISPLILKRTLRKFAQKKYKVIGIIGGEITVYPQLEKIIKFATNLGYKRINLISHGIRFADMDFLKKLVKAGNIRFYVSIQSYKAKEEDSLISMKGGFRKKIQGLRNLVLLQKQGLIKEQIYLSAVITKLNYKLLSEILLFYFKNFGIKNIRFRFIRPEGRALDNFRVLIPRYVEVLPHLNKAVLLSKNLNLDFSFDGIPFCILRDMKKFKGFMGELRDEIEKRKKQISFENQSVISQKINEIQIKIKECKLCIYNSLCGGPFKNYVKIYGPKEFKPIINYD
jgi:MoaA/NifB/PqqE/SkfB family radical SAM enzyme